ncbi:MAG: M50 family metallopeptidase [Candidatus Borkfalkiaceae bacterium]|nr:M50 family metallopeptidase [Clostridia bacterium]MDY6223964.1 M50 family metallopeptidase [Christensenellaceae bacterium]
MNSLLAFSDVMKNVGGVLAAVAVLLAMVTIHEFGHYFAGKLLGFKINEFSVGFGPAVFKKRSKKTGELFAVRVIPLGGYCAFDGEDDTEEDKGQKKDGEQAAAEKKGAAAKNGNEGDGKEIFLNESARAAVKTEGAEAEDFASEGKTEGVEAKKSEAREEKNYPEPTGIKFNDQPPWKRIIVLLAGAVMNYLLGLLLIFVMFLSVGRPVYTVVKEKPEEEETAAVTHTIQPLSSGEGGDAKAADTLETGDVILRVEGRKTYLITDYLAALKGKNAGDIAEITVLRQENGVPVEKTLRIVLAVSSEEFDSLTKTGYMVRALGVYALAPLSLKTGLGEKIGDSFVYSVKEAGMVLSSLGQLLTGKIGIKSMGGPITTIRVTSQQATSGWQNFLNIASFIGVNLAVFNLLPVPALDGSKIVFCIIEWIRKKPINRKVEATIHFIGIIVLFAFAILVDVLQLF